MTAFDDSSSAVKSITALRRGLEVLRAVEDASAISLADLHRQTGTPKATLLRILKTLQQSDHVVRDALGRYMPSPAGGQYGGGGGNGQLAILSALAAPARDVLQRRVLWPVDMAVRDGNAMRIIDTDRPTNGLAVNYRALGFRPPMLVSSLGRCYFAFCPEDERRELLAALARSPYEADQIARKPESLHRMVAHTREQGYSMRDPSFASPYSPDRFAAMSVPVFWHGRVFASLSCAWLPTITTTQTVVAANLEYLQAAARSIGEAWHSVERASE